MTNDASIRVSNQIHFDGHGLADTIEVFRDGRDPAAGGASHKYLICIGEDTHARIDFQHGARDVDGSQPGILDSALLTVLLDRYEGFQEGPFASHDNAMVINKLIGALLWMKKRADDRARRGVLGQNKL